MMITKVKRLISKSVLYFMVIIVSLAITAPFVIMLSYSFRSSHDIFSLEID